MTEARVIPLPSVALPRRLWHYCCQHSTADIAADRGTLRPNRFGGQAVAIELHGHTFDAMLWPLVWLTDIDVQTDDDVAALGLVQSERVPCDRTAYRWRVPRLAQIVPWRLWADVYAEGYEEQRAYLESGVHDPARWSVAAAPIPNASMDMRYARPS